MGQAPSNIYKLCRKVLIRYNANYRAEKFLDKGQLPLAPRHPVRIEPKETVPETELKKIHEKSEQLNEYLKKVYLTSTSTITGTPSKRPKPTKENELKAMKNPVIFVEPKEPQPNHVTLSSVVDILFNFHKDSKEWNINTITNNFNMNKKDVEKLILYYSLFTRIDSNYFNADAVEKEKEPKKITFEVYTLLEKKPARQIAGKK